MVDLRQMHNLLPVVSGSAHTEQPSRRLALPGPGANLYLEGVTFVRFFVTALALVLVLVATPSALAAEPNSATRKSPSATAKVTREAEKTLLAVASWNITGPTFFADTDSRIQLFNITSQTGRVIRTLSVLNERDTVPFLSEYSAFANALSELRKAVALKTDWAPLVDNVLNSASSALSALKTSDLQKIAHDPELSGSSPTQSSL